MGRLSVLVRRLAERCGTGAAARRCARVGRFERTFALVLGRREAAGVDVEREQEAKEAARLVQDGLGDVLRPCLVAQAPPEECPVELVDGELLEARILDDACVQLVQHVLELVAHELARHGALTAAHGIGTVERQGRLCPFPGARAVRDEAPA